MKKLNYIVLVLSLILCSDGLSQSSKINGITTEYKALNTINVQGDSLYDLSVTVHLIDSVNISKVLIQVGHEFNGSEVHNGEYNWHDSTSSSPSGFVYDRRYYMISFTIRNVVPSLLFYKANTLDFQSVAGIPYIRQNI